MQENNWNGQPPYQQPYGWHEPERKGFAIASLVLGILSLVLCCLYGGLLFGIPGLILGIVSLVKHESKMGMAIAGIITSAFGLVYGIMMLMAIVMTFQFGMGISEEAYTRMQEELYGAVLGEPEQKPGNESVPAGTEEAGVMDGAAEEDAENPFGGNSYALGDGSVVYFEENGNFIWYDDDAVHEDNYAMGTYDVYRAELAESYIVTYLGEYGVTEDELADLYQSNAGAEGSAEENFTCLVLHNESVIRDGEEQVTEPYDTNYMGFYTGDSYDAVDMAGAEDALFTKR